MNAFTTNSKSNAKNLYKNSLPMRWKMNSSGKQARPTITQFPDDWQETVTVLAALEKIESWIFSRIVESVWWQVKVHLILCWQFCQSLKFDLLVVKHD